MSAAPAYIVYGHRHAVRLVSRLVAIGLLLAAMATVFFGIVWQHGSDKNPPTTAAAGTHGGAAGAASRGRRADAPARAKRAVKPPATKPKKQKPAKPIPPNGQIPVMVLNSNGIHGVAHTLAAKVQ